MLEFSQDVRIFPVPRVIFTLAGQQISEQVIAALVQLAAGADTDQEYIVFETEEAARMYFAGGISPNAAVVLFDDDGNGFFTYLTRSRAAQQNKFPRWSQGAPWGVAVHGALQKWSARLSGCAKQIRANFRSKFNDRLAERMFPWGQPRKMEPAPVSVVLPPETAGIIQSLNTTGPDLAASIAHTDYARSLPRGSRISWLRIVPRAAMCDTERLDAAVQAMGRFEEASARLLEGHPEINKRVLAGVDLGSDPLLTQAYLHPPVSRFSVARPDLHLTQDGLFASENDEMPGGFPELLHLDRVYGVNQARWGQALNWLFAEGPLLFVVSHKWSKPYIAEFRWLVDTLRAEGYPVHFLSTEMLHELHIGPEGVFFGGQRIGTIWRQFPIFETRGRLVELVRLAAQGIVRMVPEFAHFGNKVWFPIFRQHRAFFQNALGVEDFSFLQELLPDSHLVQTAGDFPACVGEVEVASLQHLRNLPDNERDRLVLKVCGANDLAARSYGVLMGHGLKRETWSGWIDERLESGTPFLVQERQSTAILSIGVHHTGIKAPELFSSRVLLRSWALNGELTSVAGCAVPRDTTRVHGRVDMAMFAVNLG